MNDKATAFRFAWLLLSATHALASDRILRAEITVPAPVAPVARALKTTLRASRS